MKLVLIYVQMSRIRFEQVIFQDYNVSQCYFYIILFSQVRVARVTTTLLYFTLQYVPK